MKRIVLCLVIVSSFLFSSNYTKKQIAEYIKVKVENDQNPYTKYKISYKNNYCSLNLNDVGKQSATDWDINLKDVTVEFENSGVYWITLNCISGKKCIKYRHNGNSKIHEQSDATVYTNNASVIKLYNAFNDLTSKCKGIKELY